MTGRATSILCLLALLAGCGDGDGGARQEAIAREASAKAADAAREALSDRLRVVVEELQAGAVDPGRRAALEAAEKRLERVAEIADAARGGKVDPEKVADEIDRILGRKK